MPMRLDRLDPNPQSKTIPVYPRMRTDNQGNGRGEDKASPEENPTGEEKGKQCRGPGSKERGRGSDTGRAVLRW